MTPRITTHTTHPALDINNADHELNVQAGKLCDDAISTDGTTVWMWQADISDWREFSPATSIADAMGLLTALSGDWYWRVSSIDVVIDQHNPDEQEQAFFWKPDQLPRAITEVFVAAKKAEASG